MSWLIRYDFPNATWWATMFTYRHHGDDYFGFRYTPDFRKRAKFKTLEAASRVLAKQNDVIRKYGTIEPDPGDTNALVRTTRMGGPSGATLELT
jgi:hypothetical protein